MLNLNEIKFSYYSSDSFDSLFTINLSNEIILNMILDMKNRIRNFLKF